MTTSEDPTMLIAPSKALPDHAPAAEPGSNANGISSDLAGAGTEIDVKDNQDEGVPADLMDTTLKSSNRLTTSSSSATLQGKAAQDRINILREEIGKLSMPPYLLLEPIHTLLFP